METRHRIAILAVVAAVLVVYAASIAPVAQDPAYHDFADDRTFLRITNFMDVASNLPFLLVGIAGFVVLFGQRTTFVTDAERWPYAIFFAGIALTSVGSGYYHLDPDNARLVWDRLPMTLGFMGILSAVLDERVRQKLGLVALPMLVAAGIASVAYWHGSELSGHGDLRPYLLVQFGSLLIVLISLLVFPSRYTEQKWLALALAGYGLAKLVETFDTNVYETMRVVSGHTLKHLAAAGASYCVIEMLRRRSVADGEIAACEPAFTRCPSPLS